MLTTPWSSATPSTVALTSSVRIRSSQDIQPRSVTLVSNDLTFLELVLVGKDTVCRNVSPSERRNLFLKRLWQRGAHESAANRFTRPTATLFQ